MVLQLKRGDKLVIATHNPGKVWEFQQLFNPYGVELIAAGDLGIPEPEETGETFADNARLKAVISAFASGLPALGDDSGLEAEALDGAPGVYSARWAGETRDFNIAMAKLEEELKAKGATSKEARRAQFTCVLCLAEPTAEPEFYEGRAPGRLVWPPRGMNGFGYDPMFMPDGYDITFGEMEPSLKYAMTHRAAAFRKLEAAVLKNGG